MTNDEAGGGKRNPGVGAAYDNLLPIHGGEGGADDAAARRRLDLDLSGLNNDDGGGADDASRRIKTRISGAPSANWDSGR